MVPFNLQSMKNSVKLLPTQGLKGPESMLKNSGDYAVLGGTSKIAAMLLTYPFQVIRARLLQFRKRNVKPLLHLVPVSNINNCLKKHFRDL
ncbi:folate transporter 1 [Cucumis melo var. makuwa]|uniref:Folate transporter 1 n=1 Tax=Cucumis melo var. makuwa TaxID=1194695 RepID=A0A5D3DUX7_CUCMM|nr:folate transporter 1 [Cucumis melo var. makuwa]